MVLQNPLYLTIIIYLILVGAILYTKPKFYIWKILKN